MADVATVVFSFPSDESSLEQLSPYQYDLQVRNYLARLDGLPKNWAKGASANDLLDILNPAVNSIPYLFVLLAQIHSLTSHAKSIPDPVRPQGALWNRMVQFLNTFDPVQIRYVGADWRKLVELVDKIVRVLDTPAIGIVPIRTAMTRLDPTLGTFTSTHLHYMRLCHEGQAHYEAIPVLDHFIFSFPKEPINGGDLTVPCADHATSSGFITIRSGLSGKIEAGDVQEYLMLGANSYLALRQYKDAQLFLEHILTFPTQNVATGLMAEAYRKWLLVGCLIDGVPPSALKTTNGNAFKTIRAASKAYETIADAFSSGGATKLSAEIQAGSQTWSNDGNAGLVRELETHLNRFLVKNLQKTYAAVPVSTVARWMNGKTDTTTTYIQTLIDDGFLHATIENANSDPVLRFHSELAAGFTKSEEQQLRELQQQTKKTQELAAHVQAASQRLSLTKEFVEFEKRKARSKDNPEPQQSGENMDTTWETFDQDEDMMGDLA